MTADVEGRAEPRALSAPDAGAGHQPQIQALRAVAVVAVILYHFWPSVLPGGYVGVDVFFVISGYLMTKTVLHIRHQQQDRFAATMREFYARRVARILPASLVTLLAVSAVVLLAVPLVDWSLHLRQVVASMFFFQNWYLVSTSTDYLNNSNGGALQHFWSLSVEEQFYVVWPVLCVVAARVGAALPRRLRTIPLALVVGGLTAASFAYSVFETRTDAPTAYFHTGTRFWELSFGGAVFLVDRWAGSRRAASDVGGRARAVAGWLGLGLIGAATLGYDSTTPFPSWYAALPVAAAGLVVLSKPDWYPWSASRLVALRPVQYVGGISYSLYLVHWPVLILSSAALKGGAPLRIREKGALLVVTFALSALMKRVVEDRFRRRGITTATALGARRAVAARQTLWVLATAQVLVLALVVFGLQYRDSAVARAKEHSASFAEDSSRQTACFDAISAGRQSAACPGSQGNVESLVPSPLVAKDDWPYGRCQAHGGTATPVRCDLVTAGGPLLVIAGDSHVVHWIPAILPWAEQRGYRVTTFVKSGCPLTKTTTWGRECLRWNKDVRVQLERLKPDVIVTSALSAFKASELPLKVRGLVPAWEEYVARGATLIAFRDVPQPRVAGIPNMPSCLISHDREEPCRFNALDGLKYDLVSPAAAQVAGVHVVDVHGLLCPDGSCPPEIEGILTYIDYGHLSSYIARGLAKAVGTQLDVAVGR